MSYMPNAMGAAPPPNMVRGPAGGIPPAGESPRGLMGQTPADAQPRSLPEVLDEAIALTAVDRILDPNEMAAWSRAIQHLTMIAQAQGQMGNPGALGQMAQQNIQQSGMMGQPQGQTMDYGAPGAVPKTGGF